MHHRLRKLAVAGGVIAGLVAGLAPAAHAADTVNLVGSDTTYWVNNVLAQAYNTGGTSVNPNTDLIVNTPPQVIPPFPAGNFVPADSHAGAISYSLGGTVPPNGSGAGRSALVADTTGAVDVARSSSRGSEATLDYYAYALAGASWVKFAPNKVVKLSVSDLQKIFTCDSGTGLPFAQNWEDLGANANGQTGPIVPYIIQSGSGTGSFVQSKLLGGATWGANCTTPFPQLQEHDARGVATATKGRAIYFMDYAQWTEQSKSLIPDLRNGAVLGAMDQGGVAVKPSASTLNTTATRFIGTRYMYTAIKNNGTDPSHEAVMRFAGAGDLDNNGATPAANGFVCGSTTANKIIKAWGFVPLKKTADPNNGGLSSYCLKNPTAL